ncbi:MAG: CTP synthase, partial [Erysipelotrichaceae bacterium]|nr:CTP synthase [Erysipelotrichaceae bacterium]
KELQGLGISPDIVVLRCEKALEKDVFDKIALFCNIERDCVIENRTIPVLYEVPLMLKKQHLDDVVCRKLGLTAAEADLKEWKEMVRNCKQSKKSVTIGLVGKYVSLHDAYLSVVEALHHAGCFYKTKVKIKWIDSEKVSTKNVGEKLADCDGVIVPGGFGGRGIEGMIETARYCRKKNVPYLGICLGMQVAVIEFARNVCGLKKANSGEFDPSSPDKVIDFLPGQNEEKDKGGTLRLGAYPCKLAEGTVIRREYGCTDISERHRHRYEFNNEYREILQKNGMVLSGTSPDGYIVETIETGKGYFVGVQFHPEFKSRPDRPHPLFKGLIRHSLERKGG